MPKLRPQVVLISFAPTLIGLCAAGPPPEGTEVQFMAGSGTYEYQTGGCGAPTYANRAVSGSLYAEASHRHSSGVTGTVEVSGGAEKTTKSRLIDPGDEENPPQEDAEVLDKTRGLGAAAPRLGYHHKYFGAEAGASFLTDGDEVNVLPSGGLWVGVPRYAYAWGAFMDGPVTPGHLPIEAGLGHSSDRVRAKLGVGYEPSIVAEASYRFGEDLPLFIGARAVQVVTPELSGTLGGLTAAYTW